MKIIHAKLFCKRNIFMKKYFTIIILVLLTKIPLNMLTMENVENQKSSKQKLCDLLYISPEKLLMEPEEFSDLLSIVYSTYVHHTEDCNKLRECIFAATEALITNSQENLIVKNNINTVLKTMSNGLKYLKGSTQAKEFCYGIINDIDDSGEEKEEEISELTRTNFRKYQLINTIIEKNTEAMLIYSQEIAELQAKKQQKILKIEKFRQQLLQAEKKNNELVYEIKNKKKEFGYLKTAYDLLRSKELLQKNKITEQCKAVSTKIKKEKSSLDLLEKEQLDPTDPQSIEKNRTSRINSYEKLIKLSNALAYLDKDISEIKKNDS